MRRPGILHHDRKTPRIGAPSRVSAAPLGAVSLIGLLVTGLLVVSASASRPSQLSPPTHSRSLPGWMAGPLHGLWSPSLTNQGLGVAFSQAIFVMYVFYVLALIAAPRLPRVWPIAAIVIAHVIFFVAPPLPLTDIFNYINYGRMEIVHGLNPYATVPALEPHGDPSFTISNWHHLLSPYGPLFTLFTFLLVPLGVATSFWVFKASLLLLSLASLWLVWRCAELLHRDPLKAILLVGLNPLVLVWGLGGDHNDFFMMLFVLLGVLLLLKSRPPGLASVLTRGDDGIAPRRRDRGLSSEGIRRLKTAVLRLGRGRSSRPTRGVVESCSPARRLRPGGRLVLVRGWAAGAAGAGAGAVAPGPSTAVVDPPAPAAAGREAPTRSRRLPRLPEALAIGRVEALQFGCGAALVCALAIKLPAAVLLPIVFVVSPKRRWLLAGITVTAGLIAVLSYAAFGLHFPDLGTQSGLVTGVGLPNLLGYGLGLGGETPGLRIVLTLGLLIAVGLCTEWARRRTGDWMAAAGVSILVLLATASWQAPWYVLWLLPFAALTRRPYLRLATLVLGVYLIAAYVPAVDLAPPGSALQSAHARETDYLVH